MIHILLVEDEEVIRTGLMYTVDWLAMGAVVIGAAKDGKEGLEMIQSLKPDMVISDIRMPVMSGLEMIRQARAVGLRFIPILLTSYSDFDYAKQAIELQVFDYIVKPVSDEKLAEVVQRAGKQLERDKALQHVEHTEAAYPGNADNTILVIKHIPDNPHVNACLNSIEQDYTGHPSIESLADELKVSVSYLSRIFKQTTSMTFLDFLNKYRVQKAIELLSSREYKVYEVASVTGFTNYKRFYEVFKRYTGISPTDFVKTGCIIARQDQRPEEK